MEEKHVIQMIRVSITSRTVTLSTSAKVAYPVMVRKKGPRVFSGL
ncbi:hypothetical protein SAMN04487996_111103 [Dyadobacter soli]|uniref:Uncharacterized protein n=1 Tax=Dyadobacter soli TaxID=659014 RepID=A0A1G7LWS4_9BACT|nr:hypothetical protein SAMN04487996_111103 [Dyadobacter soli]